MPLISINASLTPLLKGPKPASNGGRQGVDDATLMWASAPAVVLGYKAMLYDRAQKKASEKPLPQKRPAGKTVSPSTPAQAQTSTGKRLQQLSAKDDLSPAEFKELMRLKRNRKQ